MAFNNRNLLLAALDAELPMAEGQADLVSGASTAPHPCHLPVMSSGGEDGVVALCD